MSPRLLNIARKLKLFNFNENRIVQCRLISARFLTPETGRELSRRCFHSSTVPDFRKFQSRESDFAFQFVQNYALDLNEAEASSQLEDEFKVEADYSEKSLEELLEAFRALSFHCQRTESCISMVEFDDLIKQLVKKVDAFSDEQIFQILQNLQRFPSVPEMKTKNFFDLWSALDASCVQRMSNWQYAVLLKVCNLWLKLHLSKFGDFTGKAIYKLTRRVDKLPAKALVETMFYLTVCRREVVMMDVETRFLKIFNELDINEIGIMCLAFFKTETKIKTFKLIDKIYDKTISEADKVESLTIVNILKTLRYSSDVTHAKRLELMSDALLPHIDKFTTITCLHIALLGTNLQFLHQELIEKIVQRFNNEVKEMRLKEIERFSFVLGLFDFKTQSGIEKELMLKFRDELKLRVNEIMYHPKCLAATAHYLSIRDVYDPDVIKSVLKREFIEYAYGKNHMKIGREVLCLDSYTRINLKGVYEGPQLDAKMRHNITKFQTHYVPSRNSKYKLTFGDKQLLDLQDVLEVKFGLNLITHVLPHYQRPVVVCCFDENGKGVTESISEAFPPDYSGNILTKELLFKNDPEKMKNYQLVAVVMGGWNFYIRDTETATGGLRMKLEQLEMIGYKPLLIHWHRWQKLFDDEKLAYLDFEMKKLLDSNVDRAQVKSC